MQIIHVNTFTSEQFMGSPTPVCLLNEPGNDSMQSIARELDEPVTVFVTGRQGDYRLIYFTPSMEIPACGHATLAAAAVMSGSRQENEITFVTARGNKIPARVEKGMVSMDFPVYPMENYIPSGELLKSLGIESYLMAGICLPLETLFIQLSTAKELKSIQPDFEKLLLCSDKIKEVVITAEPADMKCDFLLRSFCPWIGINEDPVTGSVHSVLAPYWSGKLEKTKLVAHQLSGEGGEIFLEVGEVVTIKGKYIINDMV